MKKFVLGVVSGAIGSIVVYFLITYFIEPMRFNLSYGFPPVAGNYLSSYPEHPDWEPEPVTVGQLGFRVSGDFDSPQTGESYELTGFVTSSRIISYQFRPKNTRLNDYGSGLIRLNRNGDGGDGYALFLSEEDERPEPVRIVVKRLADK